MRIGIVGLGRMGANIGRRIQSLQSTVHVSVLYDANPAVAEALAEELHVPAAISLAEVAAQADIVFTVVTDDAAMREIFADEPASLLAAAKGRIFINCATITPDVQREIAARIGAAGGQAVEACMAGSITQARNGTLVWLCAGEKSAFEAAKPVLEQVGSVHFIGAAGQAAEVKALVNMLMNMNTAALAEALGLGAALGLDLDMLSRVFAQTGADSRVLATDGADMIARDHEVFFSAAHAAKDSGIALRLAEDRGIAVPLAALTKARYDEVVARGFGESDKSVIAELSFPGRGTKK